ncbi:MULTISPECIES: ABC transporter substrate-binding protein [unclassified Frigoribacterium]|uniref:ABC transporter substrate-binding protein n=1 Tax=unclassified Frigoribacterium TaxID=2627005 RepID=UPI0005BBE989|nr:MULTISPECIES: ABC transporter substrate-binding protein [unclassified Frigoribacterium]KIU02061.1 peptide ABC transporter substrate-binding protein [Frigoribacterium sp. MEB024]MBD8539993.1 ABC transporter substrate-binding protein [Frigoribacterium sp. CFBP 8751]
MRSRLPVLIAATAVASLVLAGCTSGDDPDASSTPVSGGTLTYASGDAEPTCLDPHVGGNYPQALVSTQYLESLVSKDANGDVVPWLADSWEEASDGLSWTFTLKDGVTFTDGTPFDAAAVAANVAHLQDPTTLSSTGYLALGKVTGVQAVDARTARFDLREPDSALLESLSQPWLAMESPDALTRSQEVNCESPVGTGPFAVESWTKQQQVVLTRNDDYSSPPADAGHQGPAYLDEIVWRFIPDSASRYAALQAGQVDVIDNAQPDTLVAAAKDDSLDEIDAPRPGASNRIELNAGKAPFDDLAVREAFIRGVDVDSGIDSLFFGTATRSYSPLSSVEPLAFSDESLFDVDTDAANDLLDRAGWTTRDADGYRTKDGVRLAATFPVSTNQSIPAEQSLFEQVQAGAKDLGFDVTLEPLDLSSWYGALAANEYDLVSAPYTKVGPDVLRILYDSDGITPAPSGYFANLSQTSDPALDDLLTRASETSDADERADLYQQAQQIILEGWHVLPLYDQQNHYLVRSAVQGVRALPTVQAPTMYDAYEAS